MPNVFGSTGREMVPGKSLHPVARGSRASAGPFIIITQVQEANTSAGWELTNQPHSILGSKKTISVIGISPETRTAVRQVAYT